MSTDPFRHSDICGILAVVAAFLLVAASATAPFAEAQTLGAALALGEGHSCALTTAGGVKCWGENEYGQLGDGTTAGRMWPGDVSGLTGGVVAISASFYHTCAITTGGGALCWGRNDHGELGDGTTTNRTLPTGVAGLASGVDAISAGMSHTCALTTGAAKCWGYNYAGQLGDGTTTQSLTPVDVLRLSNGVAAISAARRHTCALTMPGGAKCWGRNDHGQLGDGTTTNRNSEADVTGLTGGVSSIDAGLTDHACVRTVGGGIKCWGSNYFGQLGDGTSVDSLVPVGVPALTNGVAEVAVGAAHTCAIIAGGGIKCWGSNYSGQLGDNSTTRRPAPVDVVGLASAAVAIGLGANHTCAIVIDGSVRCWGWNDRGQLGDGTTSSRSMPVSVLVFNDADGDGMTNDIEIAEGRDPLVKDNDIFADARLFAMQQYRDFLFREGDAPGIQGWGSLIGSGFSRERVADSFVTSQEFSVWVAPVVRLYFACFQRPPDYAGLVYNHGLFRRSGSLMEIASYFASSPEFLAKYGSLNSTQFVTLLYQNVLGRAPDPAGLNGWVQILNGGSPRGRVLLGFSDSVEFQGLIANEVFATMLYAGMLGRSPDAAGFASWVSYLDSGPYLHEQAINAILLSAEYRARFLP